MADNEVLDDEARDLVTLASMLIAPAHIICKLSGQADPGAAVVFLANQAGMVTKTVIATAGAKGSCGARHSDTAPCFVPADVKCQARDTVGAGDAYQARYIAALS